MGLETALIIGLAAAGGAVAAKSMSGGSSKMPDVKAENKKTAAPVAQLSEVAKKNRQRAAAFNPRGFAPPTLGRAGLLGISGQGQGV